MVYKQKITKVGNSFGIIIPESIRDTLKMKVGKELYLETTNEKTITLSLEKPSTKIDPEFFELIKSVDKQYSTALRNLA